MAEEVEAINPDLVVVIRRGKSTRALRGGERNVAQRVPQRHRKVENLKTNFEATVAQQQKEIQALATTVKEQAAQIQKVTAQIELNKPPPRQVVLKIP